MRRAYARAGELDRHQAEISLGIVLTIGPDGKLVRYESFRDLQETLAAAGLHCGEGGAAAQTLCQAARGQSPALTE